MLTISLLFFLSILAFVFYGVDKLKAERGTSRIPEAVLIVLAAIGGAFGALMGMLRFWHKVRKPVFLITVPLLFILQWVGAYFLLCYFYGSSRLLWL